VQVVGRDGGGRGVGRGQCRWWPGRRSLGCVGRGVAGGGLVGFSFDDYLRCCWDVGTLVV